MPLTQVQSGMMDSVAQYYSMKNRIINGAMVIDQRNAGASVTITNTSDVTDTLDRWFAFGTAASKFSVQQNAASVTPPVGFSNYLGVTSLSAYTVGSGDSFSMGQYIEGFNAADLGWGTANAQSITISFWVRSSLTGTFGGAIRNSAVNRSYPFSYTISAANTWEQKSIVIAGDTSGTWVGATNGIGIRLGFSLGTGSTFSSTAGAWAAGNYTSATGATSVVGTNGATFYITGVQLEKGSTATSFDYLDYGRSLMQCQRYYYRITPSAAFVPFGNGLSSTSTTGRALIYFPTTMRSVPSVLEQSGTAADYGVFETGGNANCNAVPTFISASVMTAVISQAVGSGLTAGRANYSIANNSAAFLAWSAEL